MASRLLRYLAVVGGALLGTFIASTLADVEILDGADRATRAVAFQTLAGVGAALMTVQLAMLAFFVATGRGSRLRRTLARSNGAGARTIALDTFMSAITAVAFAVLILADRDGHVIRHVAIALVALQLAVAFTVSHIAYLVMRSLEQDARDDERRALERSTPTLDTDSRA